MSTHAGTGKAFVFAVLALFLAVSAVSSTRAAIDPSIQQWADRHHILLIGTSQSSVDMAQNGFNPTSTLDPSSISGFQDAINALEKLPDYVLAAMEPQYNTHTGTFVQKAIYFSSASGRGFTVCMPTNYSQSVFKNVITGFILEQGTSWGSYQALHEFGHIVDTVGTNRSHYYWTQLWNLADDITRIFDAQGHLISDYAKSNTLEDFAEHFCYYVLKGSTFRQEAQLHPELEQRYLFLKDHVFNSLEYSDPTPPPTQYGSIVVNAVGEGNVPVGFTAWIDSGSRVTVPASGYTFTNIRAGAHVVHGLYNSVEQSVTVNVTANASHVSFNFSSSYNPPPSSSLSTVQWLIIACAVVLLIMLVKG